MLESEWLLPDNHSDSNCEFFKLLAAVHRVIVAKGKTLRCIDNHGCGYLGMARWFNVHMQVTSCSIETVLSQLRKRSG